MGIGHGALGKGKEKRERDRSFRDRQVNNVPIVRLLLPQPDCMTGTLFLPRPLTLAPKERDITVKLSRDYSWSPSTQSN